MATHSSIKSPKSVKKINLIHVINRKIEKEQHYTLGIPLFVIMFNTGIASLTVGLSLYQNISYLILGISIFLAMATLICVLSLQKFKTTIWLFLISITVNIGLLFYQIIKLQ